MLKTLILLFLVWRLVLFVPLFVGQSMEYRQGYPYTSPLYFLTNRNTLVSHFLISPWANFDGVYYLIIAASGYTESMAGFFPLFPFVIHIASLIFGSIHAFDTRQYFLVFVLVSIFFLASLIMIYKLVKLDFNNNTAILTILAILAFPTSFFFATFYSESLFLLLLILSFYFARKGLWFWASISAAFLTATRFVGIAIIPALLYEFIISEKTLFKKNSLYLFLTPLGILSYVWFNLQKWGSAFYFIAAQGNLQNNRTVDNIIFVHQTVFRYFKILTSVSTSQFEWWIALLEISVFIFSVVLLYIAWKKKIRLSYLIFAVIAFLIPISTGTFSGLPRYSLILFPIFLTLALAKNKFLKISYSLISILLLFLLFMLFAKGYYIA